MKLSEILKEYNRTIKDIEKLTLLAKKLYLEYFILKGDTFVKDEIKFIAVKVFTPKYKISNITTRVPRPNYYSIKIHVSNHTPIIIDIDSRSLTITELLDDAFEE